MAVDSAQGAPDGLFVVTVIMIILSASPAAGVYVNSNGDVFTKDGLTEPVPFSVMVTLVALPPKVLSLTVIAVVPHVLPPVLLSVTVGGFAHPHVTSKLFPVVVHPDAFLTVIV